MSPGSIENGFVSGKNGTTYNSYHTFECNEGYNLNGTATIICQSDGKWDNKIATCTGKPFFMMKKQDCTYLGHNCCALTDYSMLSKKLMILFCFNGSLH